MCDRTGHRIENEMHACGSRDLTLTEKWKLFEAFRRDHELTFGEELAKHTAIRELARWEDYADEHGWG